eukprot:4126036-Alexandrium_andersonii.AAC.1
MSERTPLRGLRARRGPCRGRRCPRQGPHPQGLEVLRPRPPRRAPSRSWPGRATSPRRPAWARRTRSRHRCWR